MTRNEPHGVDLLAPLEKRRDFLRCARGRKAVRHAFVLQMAAKPEPLAPGFLTPEPPRVGFTASRKIGGAVQRNRAKRRLRAAARAVVPKHALQGFDYVLVARRAVLTCAYADLEADLRAAMAELTRARARAGRLAPESPSPSPAEPASPPSTAS